MDLVQDVARTKLRKTVGLYICYTDGYTIFYHANNKYYKFVVTLRCDQGVDNILTARSLWEACHSAFPFPLNVSFLAG